MGSEQESDEGHGKGMKCALCETPLTAGNATREHVIPNALGGRKTVRNFICEPCNSTSGHEWDAALVRQLEPLCAMLDIRRGRGRTRPARVKTLGGKPVRMHPDGTMTSASHLFERKEREGRVEVRIQAGTTAEVRKRVSQLARKHPQVDVEEVMKTAKASGSGEAVEIPLEVGGLQAGRSVVKSCLAMACDSGLATSNCGEARRFLLDDGEPCYGFHCGPDLVRNRPDGTFFHCVHVCGDPERGRLLGYAEYFGWLKFVACLSRSYEGAAFSRGYAIDPVSGRQLDLAVDLALDAAAVAEIFEQARTDFSEHFRDLAALVGAWKEIDRSRARSRAIDSALKAACEECGIREGDIPSDGQAAAFARAVARQLVPHLLHELSGSRFTGEELAEIVRRPTSGGA